MKKSIFLWLLYLCSSDPLDSLSLPVDTDGDFLADCVDTDDDNDGTLDTDDAFPLDTTEDTDTDSDGIGNNADPDDDGDGFLDGVDAFPLDGTEWLDTDSDGTGNNADLDDDGDGYSDIDEINCSSDPLDSLSLPVDTDGDFLADCVDTDDDNDGTLDTDDAFPLDPTEDTDTDSDGVGNNADADDDNDGILDTVESFIDFDLDGYPNHLDLDSDNDGCPDVLEAGFEDSDNDGLLGSNSIFVDSQGLVQEVIAYEIPLDENQNGDFDFLDFGSDFAPIINLPDQISYKIKEPVKFKINLSSYSNVSYQWQRSIDGGLSFSNLNNSSRYSGVNSDELIFNDPDYPDHNSLFRVELKPLAYACGVKIISNATILFYNELFIPNAFSPNGDGVNDCWEILGLQNYPRHLVEVYNRLGIKIYKSTRYEGDWCGTYNGSQIPDGVYFYHISLTAEISEKGYIFIKRN